MSWDIIPSFDIRQVVFESDMLLVAIGVGDLMILYRDRSLRCPWSTFQATCGDFVFLYPNVKNTAMTAYKNDCDWPN